MASFPDNSARNPLVNRNTNPLAPSGAGINRGVSTSTQESTEHTVQNSMDPNSLALLQGLIQTFMNGGTAQQQKEIGNRDAALQQVFPAFGDYSKQAAFNDAQALMAQQLRLSLQKQMPALQRAVEGAGTSAGSMQGLLANQMATESAQAAGALGAEQAKAYGAIRAQLAGVLEGLTRPQNTVENSLLQALQVLKGAQTTVDSTKSGSSSSPMMLGGSGGGNGSSGGSKGGMEYPAMPAQADPFAQLFASALSQATPAQPVAQQPIQFDPWGTGNILESGELSIRPSPGQDPQGYDWTNQQDYDSTGGTLIW